MAVRPCQVPPRAPTRSVSSWYGRRAVSGMVSSYLHHPAPLPLSLDRLPAMFERGLSADTLPRRVAAAVSTKQIRHDGRDGCSSCDLIHTEGEGRKRYTCICPIRQPIASSKVSGDALARHSLLVGRE